MEEYAILFTMVISYFIGSIPFGLILSKLFLKTDIRLIGSGSIGATNVSRVNKKLAVLTLFLDMAKGLAAVLLAKELIPYLYDSTLLDLAVMIDYVSVYDFMIVGGLFAVLGHNFPIWLKFKGGKGVATTFGVILSFNPLMAGIALLIWMLGVFGTGYSAVGALFATVSIPYLAYVFFDGYEMVFYGFCILTVLSVLRHYSNIKRLIKGEENRFWGQTSNKKKK